MPNDKRPLDFFLYEHMKWEHKAIILLKQSLAETEAILRTLEKKVGPGALQRGYQLESARIAMKQEMAALWRSLGYTVAAAREETAAAAINSAYHNSMLERVPGMTKTRYADIVKAERAAAKANVEASLARLQGRGYVPLSQRVYNSGQLVTGQVDRIINKALARGASAKELAQAVLPSINPNVQGGVSYAAMRLGRTENNNSFHARQVDYARETPWVTGTKWHLSGSHPENDVCDTYADQVWADPNEVPAKPHPNCLCYTTYETLSYSKFLDDPASQAHIDELMKQAGYSDDFIALSAA